MNAMIKGEQSDDWSDDALNEHVKSHAFGCTFTRFLHRPFHARSRCGEALELLLSKNPSLFVEFSKISSTDPRTSGSFRSTGNRFEFRVYGFNGDVHPGV